MSLVPSCSFSGFLAIQSPFAEKITLFPTELSWHLCHKSMDPKCQGLFLDLSSVLLICTSLEIRKWEPSSSVLLFKNGFDYSGTTWTLACPSLQKTSWLFSYNYIGPASQFGEHSHLNIKSLGSWTWVSFHLFISTIISCDDVLQFSMPVPF